MVQRTKNEIITSVQTAIQAASPQVRVDVAKGPFYYLAAQGVAGPLADTSRDVERMALLSTHQFPNVATQAEALALARAYAIGIGSGGFSGGIAYFVTGRRPVGSDSFTVQEGATVSTAANRGVVFEAVESRSLTAANADAFFNPSTRRFELPVQVQALSAGEAGNIPARTLTVILGGANNFDGVTNLVDFRGGTAAQSVAAVYARAQQRLAGLDNFSRGGLKSRVLEVDVDRIQAVELTYSTEYPTLFYRLPDDQAVDIWVLNTAQEVLTTDTFVAANGQTQFVLNQKPALSLSSAFVNGVPVTATLVLDTSLEVGRSTREQSRVVISPAANAGDVVDITYSYDNVLNSIQSTLDGLLTSSTGSLFATDILVRYPRSFDFATTVTGTVLGTFDPTTIEEEVATVIGDYIANGTGTSPLLGGTRTPAELRDAIKAQVPGIATLSIPIFGRKSLGTIVESVDIPRNAVIDFADAADLVVSFT